MISCCFSPQFNSLIPASSPGYFREVFKGANNARRKEHSESPEADIRAILHLGHICAFHSTCDLIESGDHVVFAPKTYVPFCGSPPELTGNVFHLRLVSVEDGGHLIFRAHFFLGSLNRDTALSVSVPLSEIREL